MVQVVPPGLRERKKQATYRAIRVAAVRLGLERGVEHVTVEDICAAVDIAPRTFSNYFAAKDDAFIGAERESTAGFADAILARPAAEAPLLTLRNVLKDRVETSMAAADGADLVAQLRLVRENPSLMPRQLARFAAVERVIAESIAQRTGTGLVADLRPVLLAALASTVMRVAMERWSVERGRSPAELIDEVFEALQREF